MRSGGLAPTQGTRNRDSPAQGDKSSAPDSATSQLTASGSSLQLSEHHVLAKRRSAPPALLTRVGGSENRKNTMFILKLPILAPL